MLRTHRLSIIQIILWGGIGIVALPALAALSLVATRASLADTLTRLAAVKPALNPGFVWLISLSAVVMMPIMVLWLVWMWQAWKHTATSGPATANWGYEYE